MAVRSSLDTPSPRRWLVLLAVFSLNLTSAMVWLTFSPVAYKAADFYQCALSAVNWLSLVFLIASIPFGMLATWTLERHGLSVALLTAAWSTCGGSSIRVLSAIEIFSPTLRLGFLFMGQSLAACGVPFSLFAPAKMASMWFPHSQRTIANTLGTLANPIGVVAVGIITSSFVKDNGELDAFNLLLVTAVASCCIALLCTAVMCGTEKPTQTLSRLSTSDEDEDKPRNTSMLDDVKALLSNRNYVVLLVTVGGGVGMYSAFVTLLEQILCPFGYTDAVSGYCSAVLTGTGVVGAIVVGVYCDVKKQFSTALKFCYVVVSGGIVIFAAVFRYNLGHYLLLMVSAFGFFAMAIFPVGVELSVEATFPTGVALTSGLVMLSGQSQSILLVTILQALGRPITLEEMSRYDSQCHHAEDDVVAAANSSLLATTTHTAFTKIAPATENVSSSPVVVAVASVVTYDMSVSTTACASYTALLCLLLLAFFRPKYNRVEAETRQADDRRCHYAKKGAC